MYTYVYNYMYVNKYIYIYEVLYMYNVCMKQCHIAHIIIYIYNFTHISKKEKIYIYLSIRLYQSDLDSYRGSTWNPIWGTMVAQIFTKLA